MQPSPSRLRRQQAPEQATLGYRFHLAALIGADTDERRGFGPKDQRRRNAPERRIPGGRSTPALPGRSSGASGTRAMRGSSGRLLARDKDGAAPLAGRTNLVIGKHASGHIAGGAVAPEVMAKRNSDRSATVPGRPATRRVSRLAISRALPAACRGPCSRSSAGTRVAAPRRGRNSTRRIHVVVWNRADRSSISPAAFVGIRIAQVQRIRATSDRAAARGHGSS
jgi:hypothetical protein